MNNEQVDANLNNSDCMHSKANLFSTTYYNICTNATATVPYGAGDLLLDGFLILVVAAVLSLAGIVLHKVLKGDF